MLHPIDIIQHIQTMLDYISWRTCLVPCSLDSSVISVSSVLPSAAVKDQLTW